MTENTLHCPYSKLNDSEASELKATDMDLMEKDNDIHQLKFTWTMFYDPPYKRTTQENYNTNLQTLASVDSVETTCLILHNIPDASDLPLGTNLSFFLEKNIKPSWEDPNNTKGGRWTCSIPKDTCHTITKLWKDAVFACVGNEYASADLINGVVLNIRQKADRVAFWISDASSDETLKHMAVFLKSYLELPNDHKFTFQLHSDAVKNISRDHLVF